MGTLKEWRCAAHGEFENTSGVCRPCGNKRFVKQEIRTAPAYRRPNMKFIDGTLREIAQDAGLTDLKNDPKAGVSVLEAMRKKPQFMPEWVPLEHAAPGFSANKDIAVPKVSAESMGFVPTSANEVMAKLPHPSERTRIMGRWKGD